MPTDNKTSWVVSEYWPIIFLRMVGQPPDEEFRVALEELEALINRRQPYGCLVDATMARQPNLNHRHGVTSLMKRTEHLAQRFCLSSAVVMNSALFQTALNAILWVHPPPQPVRCFNRIEDACSFLSDAFTKRGLPIPPLVASPEGWCKIRLARG